MELAVGSTASTGLGAARYGQGSYATDGKQQRGKGIGKTLSAAEQRTVDKLQATDRAVRAHESAHQAAGAGLAGGATYTYETGPDGRRYAVGGEVSINAGAERDPRATIAKMRQVVAAALAPVDPSSQDRAVASQARATMAEAERQLSQSQPKQTSASKPVAAAYRPIGQGPGQQVDITA